MKRKLLSILTVNLLPPLIFFALISAYTFLIFIPGLEHAAESGEGTGHLLGTLFPYTAGMLVLIALLFIFVTVRGLRLEMSRERLKESATLLDEEFQSWVETTADGFIYIPDSGSISADDIVLEMLDYTPEEFAILAPEDFINTDVDGKELRGYITEGGTDITGRYETRLVSKDGQTSEVLVSASRIRTELMSGIILIVKNMSELARTAATRIDVQRDDSLIELQSALQYIYQSAGSMMVEVLTFDGETEIIEAVERMTAEHKNNFIVVDNAGYAEGIVTDQDLRQRVLAGGNSIHSKVREIMSSPVVTAPVNIMFFEAFRLMRDHSIRQLLITDESGIPVGLLTEKTLIEVQSTNTAAFSEELLKADTVDEMRDCYRRLVFSVRTLVQSGAKASYIVNLVSKTSEIITEKLIKSSFKKFGPPPCDFAFIVMGSEGRGEQTLFTDQDNGIIFSENNPERIEKYREYFLRLGKQVSDSLNYIGYSYCKGGVMASNRKWVKTGNEWRNQIHNWFAGEDPDRLLDLNILFDFKCVYGSYELAAGMRQSIWNAVESYPGFLRELAAAVSVFKPGLTVFGRIQTKYTDADDEVFDIKKALGPLIIYARTMALRERIEFTSTTARLRELKERGILNDKQCRNFENAFDFLTQLRFRDQVQTIEDGESMDNLIYIEDLSEVEIISLRRIFKQISSAQNNLRIALTGSMR